MERNIGSDHPNSSFLFRLGLKSGDRELLAVALNRDVRRNLTWARSLRDALEKASISPKRTTLLISAAEEEVSELQEKDDVGFGTVYAFDRYELVAQLCCGCF